MSQLNVNIIKNRVGNNGPTISGNTTISGILTATKFVGDGEELTGLPSAGLGTALSEDKTSPLNVIYYTDSNLGIGETITVDIPGSAKAAYTQYPQITLSDGADLIVTADNDFIPDILGISTAGGETGTGNGGRVRADNFTNRAGTGAPNANHGLIVTGIITATSGTFSGNVSVGGTLTYRDVTNIDSVGMITARKGIQVLADGINAVGVVTATGGFVGNLTGTATVATNAQGLTGTPSITVNGVTATQFSGNGLGITNINAGNIVAGIVTTARLGSGNNDATTFLNGHGEFKEAGGGAWTYLATVTASNSATMDFTSNIDGTYDHYVFVATNIMPTAADRELRIRFYSLSSWTASSYGSVVLSHNAGNGSYLSKITSMGTDTFGYTNTGDNLITTSAAAGGVSFTYTVVNPAHATMYTWGYGQLAGIGNGLSTVNSTTWTNGYKLTESVSGVRFYANTGNITSGNIRMYGINKS